MICFFFTPKSGVMVPYKLVKTGAHSRGHAACRPRNILESQTCAAQPWYYLTPTTSFHSGGGGTWNPKISEMTSTKSSVESNIFVKVVYKHNDICTFFFVAYSNHFEVFPSDDAHIWMVSEICSLTYMNLPNPSWGIQRRDCKVCWYCQESNL